MKKLLSFLICSIFTIAVWSQNVDETVNKYFESIGGKEKWKSVKTMQLIGTVHSAQGDFEIEMFRKAPDKYLLSVSVMGQKFIPQAFDGETAWTINPFSGNESPQKLPAEQTELMKLQAEFDDPFINYKQNGDIVTYEGIADVEGVKCYVLKMIKNKDKANELTYSYHFDSETYLPLLVKQSMKTGPMAGQEVSVYYSDYQDTGKGLLMPYKIDSRTNGQSTQNIQFKTIVVDGEISDDVFKYKGN